MRGKTAKKLRKLVRTRDRTLLSVLVVKVGRRLQMVHTTGQLYRLAKKNWVWIKHGL